MYQYYRRAASTFGTGPGSIVFNGRDYVYRGYAYENYIDAFNYAFMLLLNPSSASSSSQPVRTNASPAPSLDALRLMRKIGIVFVAGHYYYGTYRYDSLHDACAYARLVPGQEISQQNVQLARAAHHINLLQMRRMQDASGKTIRYLPVGHIEHCDIFPESAPTTRTFKRTSQKTPRA